MFTTRSSRVFDLENRAQLAINSLTRLLDPERNYQPYFIARYDEEPVTACHRIYDYADATGRFVDALGLARLMSGSDDNREIDEKLEAFLISLIEEDGLSWIPKAPWTNRKRAEMFSQRSTMLGLLTLYRTKAKDQYLYYVKRMVHRLWEISIKKEGYVYYPSMFYYPGGWESTDEPLENGVAGWSALQQFPVLQYYEISQDKVALNLAKGLINFLLTRAHDFNEDRGINAIPKPLVPTCRNHFHSRSAAILATLKYGLITGESKYTEWAKNAYEQAKKWGSSFGWFPENLNNTERSETCSITDMIEIATMLARNGYPQYWDEVEAFGLNHLLESQMLRTGWIKNITSHGKLEKCIFRYCDNYDPNCTHQEECFTSENVVERNLGGFAGWSKPNDYIAISEASMMQCCHAAGTRGLYALWYNAVRKEKEGLFVNLLISRNTKWAKVESLFPEVGILRVIPHIETELFIRKPTWMEGNIEFTVNGKPSPVEVRHGFFNLGARRPGDEILLHTPLVENRKREKIGDAEYGTRWVGNIVIDIDPTGTIYPLYQRSHLLKDIKSI